MKNFTEIVLKGSITSTSNKTNKKFKNANSTKSIYFVPEKVEDVPNEIQIYLSKDGTSFAVIRAAKNVTVREGGNIFETIDCLLESETLSRNFKIDNCYVCILKIKDDEEKQTYCRLTSILVQNQESLEWVEPLNPFNEVTF